MIRIKVEPADRKYLNIQVGELSDHVEDPGWQRLYEGHLFERFCAIEPFLTIAVSPGLLGQPRPVRYCDIGGGLSGISVLMNVFYGGQLSVNVIDGDGPAVMLHHGIPFSSHPRTRAFLVNNGVKNPLVWHPTQLPNAQFDLITSFRAWCFHLEPSVYLGWVKAHLSRKGLLIVDVRKDDPEWLKIMRNAFPRSQLIADKGKGALWLFQL